MTTTINKQKVIDKVFTALGKQPRGAEAAPRRVLEQFVYAICREGTTRDAAEQIFSSLEERFFDWNEVRVSSTHELVEIMDGLVADAEPRSQRLINFLQEVFDTTFSFDLERLQKEGVKQAAKKLARYQTANDYAIASVVQQSLGGHAIPLDDASLRVLRRLGLVEDAGELEALRASLEHHIPKTKGALFVDLISALAESTCTPVEPNCPACPLRPACVTGAAYTKPATAAAGNKKPR
jgi:endonuclease III